MWCALKGQRLNSCQVQVGKLIPSSFNNARQAPLTILGASVPPLDRVTDLEGGMLIENTPNINFTGIFGSLTAVNGPIIVAGNNQLTSLEGELEGSIARSFVTQGACQGGVQTETHS